MLTAVQRGDKALYETATRLDLGDFPSYKWSGYMKYRITKALVLTDGILPWRPRPRPDKPNEPDVRAGDVRIDIRKRRCLVSRIEVYCGETWDPPITYVVRRSGRLWEVVMWQDLEERGIRNPGH